MLLMKTGLGEGWTNTNMPSASERSLRGFGALGKKFDVIDFHIYFLDFHDLGCVLMIQQNRTKSHWILQNKLSNMGRVGLRPLGAPVPGPGHGAPEPMGPMWAP